METIIVSGKATYFTDGKDRKKVTKREAEAILTRWTNEGKKIRHNYLMGGKVVQCYCEGRA